MATIGRYGESVIVFNQREPYLGSLYTVSGGRPIHVARLDGLGIYFRLIKDPLFKDSWWTVMFSLWYPITAFGIMSAIVLLKRLKERETNGGANNPSKAFLNSTR